MIKENSGERRTVKLWLTDDELLVIRYLAKALGVSENVMLSYTFQKAMDDAVATYLKDAKESEDAEE